MLFSQVDLSIVIPTRTPSAGLDHAVRSAMTFLPHIREIVVSVNSSDAKCVRELSERHEKVRIVSPGRELCHAAHWEFALEQTRGEWIALLTDRGVLRHDWLDAFHEHHRNSPLLTFRTMAVLKHGSQRFDVQLPWFSGGAYAESSAPWRAAGCRMQFAEHGPYLLNSFVHRSVLERVRASAGNVCGHLVGDCGFYARCIAAGIDWFHIERPLVIMHSAETGIGASLVTGSRSPAVESFVNDVAAAGGFCHAPLPEVVTNMNVRANEWRAAIPEGSIDIRAYVAALGAELAAQAETFPPNARRTLGRFAHEHGVAPVVRGKSKPLFAVAKKAMKSLLGAGGTALHRSLNLPVRSFPSLDEALEYARRSSFSPNRMGRSVSAWN